MPVHAYQKATAKPENAAENISRPFTLIGLGLERLNAHVVGVQQIELNVVFRPGWPRALVGKRMSGAGDHPPTGGGEALDGGMADAAAGTG